MYCCAASANVNVTMARSRPRTRSAPAPIAAATSARHRRHHDQRDHGWELRQVDHDAMRAVAEPERVAVDQGGEAQRADPGERGLPERDLPGPTGEHDERQGDQREQQHVRVQELA